MQVRDTQWMRQALRLARRGWGRTSPNPMVGAVVVRDGRAAGTGYHRRAGLPHAEINALDAAASAAHGATLYVTLEPCSTAGRTPPCTDAIVRAGVSRVVVGCLDANPRHAGRGLDILRSRGLSVSSGVLADQCRELNEAFFAWIRHGRPFVLLKMAMTIDGKIATAAGESRWITGEKARARVQRLRQWADAIMVGAETVRLDDPSLTVRAPRNWACQPRKLIWTRDPGHLPPTSKIWADPEHPPEFVEAGSRSEWDSVLSALGSANVTALLVEGGGELAASCLHAGVVDKVEFFVAPKILGGRASRPVVGGAAPESLAEALPLRDVRTRRVGEDILVTGYLSDVYGID